MKLQKTIWGMLLGLSMTAISCNQENSSNEQNTLFSTQIGEKGSSNTIISVDSSLNIKCIITNNTDGGDRTRSNTVGNVWTSGDKVAMKINNTVYSYTIDGNGNLTSANPFYWSASTINVSAWFPYSTTYPSAYTVNSDQTGSGYQNSDLLYASEKKMTLGVTNTLAFNHVGAKVVVNVVNAEAATSATDVTAITINGINPHVATTATGCVASYEALCVPATVMSGKNIFTLTVNNHEYSYAPTNLTLEGGKSYTFNVTVKKTTNGVNIGDYLFNDGTWGTLASLSGHPEKKPIAVIFSNTQDMGYHGYAIALTNASDGVVWGTNNVLLTDYTDWESMKDDKDGLYHYDDMVNNGSNTNDYIAGYTANAYKKTIISPHGDWYLPSIGEWYDILVNLGGMPANPTSTADGRGSFQNVAGSVLTNLAKYFVAASNAGYSATAIPRNTTQFWSSSEYSSWYAYAVEINSSNIELYHDEKNRSFAIRAITRF